MKINNHLSFRGRQALLVSEAGNAAVTIADIIKDPTSAPFAMLGLIVGAAGGGGKLPKTESLGEASKARGGDEGGRLGQVSAEVPR